ncbi:MAG: hypothetical protein ACOH18_05315 [Candidatus Saccharimonadaceae bacterium]
MQDEQYIIDTLGINEWPEDKRGPVIAEATMRIGESIVADLSEQQFNEYSAIVDDDHDVIDAWLEQNVSDYKENLAYKEIEAGYEADSEKNNPAKLFASIAWIQVNVPDVQARIDKTLQEYKQEVSAQ